MSSIFEGFLTTPELLEAFIERNFLQAVLRFEGSLARAQLGLIPEVAAKSIMATCKIVLFNVLANLDALRAVLPADAADEWFNPALALQAAEITRRQIVMLGFRAGRIGRAGNGLSQTMKTDQEKQHER